METFSRTMCLCRRSSLSWSTGRVQTWPPTESLSWREPFMFCGRRTLARSSFLTGCSLLPRKGANTMSTRPTSRYGPFFPYCNTKIANKHNKGASVGGRWPLKRQLDECVNCVCSAPPSCCWIAPKILFSSASSISNTPTSPMQSR